MTRLTIDISGEEKQQIKALAALRGKTLKDYVDDAIEFIGKSSLACAVYF